MENLSDISEPKVLSTNLFNFPSVHSVSMGEKQFLPLELNKQMEN